MRFLAVKLRKIKVGDSPSWLRHRILIPTCVGSNPTSPAKSRFFGESPSGKASDFDSDMRRFDPYLPSQLSACGFAIRAYFILGKSK